MLEVKPKPASESTNRTEQALVEETLSSVPIDRSELAVTHVPYDSRTGMSWSNTAEEYPCTISPSNKGSHNANRTHVSIEEIEPTQLALSRSG